MVFEDLNTYDGRNTLYSVCNENLGTWRKLLKDISVDTGVSICSGGEVSFFAVLPIIKKKLDLIDHSYGSMYYAIGKHHVIEKLGSKEAWKLFSDTPDRLSPSSFYSKTASSKSLTKLGTLFKEANANLPTHTHTHRGISSQYPAYHLEDFVYRFRLMVNDLSQKDLTEFRKNREKLTFLHGDMDDCIDRGPYDFAYLSNALSYLGRNGSKFHVQSYVKPGGFVALTHNSSPPPHVAKFEEIARERVAPNHRQYGLGWTYCVYRTPEAA